MTMRRVRQIALMWALACLSAAAQAGIPPSTHLENQGPFTVAVPAGGIGTIEHSCAQGTLYSAGALITSITDNGGDITNDGIVRELYSAPSGSNTWRVRYINTGSAAATVHYIMGLICLDGSSSSTLETSTAAATLVAPGSTATIETGCTTGTLYSAGALITSIDDGSDITTSGQVLPLYAAPSATGTWRVRYRNSGGTAATVNYIWNAICEP